MTDRNSTGPGNGVGPISRRTLLQVGGAAAVVVGVSGLAACTAPGGGPAETSGAPSGGGTPVRGGTLRVGATSGGSGDTLEAQSPLTTMDFLRAGALFEQLVQMNGTTGAPELVLAESIEPNADATEWTIRIKPDILFHNGKTLTADDVLFSLRRIEENSFPGLITMGPLDLAAATVVDPLTLRIPFDAPYSIFVEGLAGVFATRIVPQDYDPANPVGTGPFTFGSFTPGQESTFPRFDDYWQEGLPYLDELVIINFADETAQLNALQSGQVDLINQLSSTSVSSVEAAGGSVVVSKTRAFVPFTMRVDEEPFSDVRVRQALRLLVDREAFNQQVYGGLGAIGNDTFGAIDPAYKDAVPQREQDLEQAKSLLRSAGFPELQVELYSSPIGPGATAAASVFATQAAQAGVQVKIRTQDPTQFFAQSYTQVAFAQSFWNTGAYLTMAQQGMADGAPFNEIHQTDAGWQSLYAEALATVDATARDALVQELIRFDYEEGGYIIPAYFPGIEGMNSRVGGVTENITGLPINGSSWQGIWLQS
ncbi:ABC transporter substrate-binding protein [Herbiconiux sp. CPCC 203407]|uniref:ABC transporter substrate-binding protein n=1 Tax=Herbiconiux oxytropis TaxID=2970915 RepID=A0AA41XAC2_9MICO|nr:ABC transporter substrate-binding protein [Herbiconiux oxytropis]MCS5721450.1 ABC transporter substrate-binding protein [Herbiconiux oxytropis]MCS5724527.1 ABC transporter substrate-binding protein [Herbiconiux oxytropis]